MGLEMGRAMGGAVEAAGRPATTSVPPAPRSQAANRQEALELERAMLRIYSRRIRGSGTMAERDACLPRGAQFAPPRQKRQSLL